MLHEIAEKFGMESNGYSLKHDENFEFSKNWHLPCYISENADSVEEIETRDSIRQAVEEWLKEDETKEYLLEAHDNIMPKIDDTFIEGWVVEVYSKLEWQSVGTILNQYTD